MLPRKILAAAFLSLMLVPAAQAQAPQAAPAARLPDSEGAQLVTAQCAGICHGTDRFAFQRHAPEEWRRIVLQMVSNGAQLSPDEIASITQYFAANLSDTGTHASGK